MFILILYNYCCDICTGVKIEWYFWRKWLIWYRCSESWWFEKYNRLNNIPCRDPGRYWSVYFWYVLVLFRRIAFAWPKFFVLVDIYHFGINKKIYQPELLARVSWRVSTHHWPVTNNLAVTDHHCWPVTLCKPSKRI